MQCAQQVISVAMLRRCDDQKAAYLHFATIVNFIIKKNLIIYSCSLLHYYQREIYRYTLSTSTTVPAQLLLRSITITPASVPGRASYINNTKCEPKYTSAHLHICTTHQTPLTAAPRIAATKCREHHEAMMGGGLLHPPVPMPPHPLTQQQAKTLKNR
jgi:hypothetical protein